MEKIKQVRNRDAARRAKADGAVRSEMASAVRANGLSREAINLYETDEARAHSAVLLAQLLGERHDQLIADMARSDSAIASAAPSSCGSPTTPRGGRC